jgi:hypothetical protein
MNKRFLIILFIFFGYFVASNASFSVAREEGFELDSGIIEYVHSNNNPQMPDGVTSKGKQTLYFKNSGRLQARQAEIETIYEGGKELIRGLVLVDLDQNTAHIINEDKNIGWKSTANKLVEIPSNNPGDMIIFTDEIKKNFEMKKNGTDKVLGRTCDVWESFKFKSKLCIWKGILLKSEEEFFSTIAVDIQENVPVPEDVFTVPEDVKIEDVDNPTGE